MKRTITRTVMFIVHEVEEIRSSSAFPAAPVVTDVDGEEIPAVLRPSLVRCSTMPPKLAVGAK